jgi:hypothetical protein
MLKTQNDHRLNGTKGSLYEVPVRCPGCQRYSLTSIPAIALTRAVSEESGMMLTSECHDTTWAARPTEFADIKRCARRHGLTECNIYSLSAAQSVRGSQQYGSVRGIAKK